MATLNYSHQKKTGISYTPLSGKMRVEYLRDELSSA